MSASGGQGSDVYLARELVEQLIRTGLMLSEMLGSLLDDLPAHAFPGENNAEVLLDMVAGTCAPVVRASGEAGCAHAIALIGAVGERVLTDLTTAAEMAKDEC